MQDLPQIVKWNLEELSAIHVPELWFCGPKTEESAIMEMSCSHHVLQFPHLSASQPARPNQTKNRKNAE